MMLVRSVVSFSRRHPVSRGMVIYALLYPASNITQQLIQQRERLDWKESLRFSFYGAAWVAPSLYAWVRIVGKLIPGNSLRVAISKALVEQVLYSPFAITSFYVGLGLLEGKTLEEAITELKAKFIPTYKTGICVWPLVQTVNFAFIKERNRVMVTGTVSFFWMIFMSYMKQLELKAAESAVIVFKTS